LRDEPRQAAIRPPFRYGPSRPRRLVPCLAILALAGASSGAALAAPPTDEVKRFAQVVTEGTASGNVDAIAALYAPTALLLPPDGSIVARREAIRGAFAANQAIGPNRIEFGTIQVDGDDLQAIAVWTWTLTITPAGRPPVKVAGRSMLYLKRAAEGWQIVLDMYQSRPAN
jgi:ketosteroid isomerase-like protein